jgi:hypothetical protein
MASAVQTVQEHAAFVIEHSAGFRALADRE